MSTAGRQPVVLGTAGHIDHGKTSLVRRLSGVDTDRLPEEKTRGISIDLGFAPWQTAEFDFGIVDVPGHERFIRNMVAGAVGIDLAVLVVAADDGVMPQTREHLEIMNLLGVPGGVVAITKMDLVDPELAELVEAELVELTAGTFLEGCPIVGVSSQTGAGLPALQAALETVARKCRWTVDRELFQMPVDRVFSVPGHGTVVTGTVHSGTVQTGEMLELFPGGRLVRVRGLQHHGQMVPACGHRQRAAINLAGIAVDEIRRGDELATPGYLAASHRLFVRLDLLPRSPVNLRDRMRLNLHLGTAEVPARLVLKGGAIEPGGHGYGELRLARPVAATYGQRFVLRRPSPAMTIAGGMLLDPQPTIARRPLDTIAEGRRLESSDVLQRLSQLLEKVDQPESLELVAARRVGMVPGHYALALQNLTAQGVLIDVGEKGGRRPRLLHRVRRDNLAAAVLKRIRGEIDRHQPRRSLPRKALQNACRNLLSADLVEPIFESLIREGVLVASGNHLGPADQQVRLTKNQLALRNNMLAEIAGAGLQPPSVKDFAGKFGQPQPTISRLLELCAEENLLVNLGGGLFYSLSAIEQARLVCRQVFATASSATLSELRQRWNVSRRYALPLAVYLDAEGVLQRNGDVRRAGPMLNSPRMLSGSDD
jgi:selenocysteine-specific elongation factor